MKRCKGGSFLNVGQLRAADFEAAIGTRSLFLEYQKIVDLESGHIAKFEALLRWRHPDLGVLPAKTFLRLARRPEVMTRLDAWVLDTACGHLAERHAKNAPAVPLAVNMTAEMLASPMCVSIIETLLQRWNLSPKLLEVELTEHFPIKRLPRVREVFRALRDLGIRVTLDDFGAGYAGLTYASELAPDALKIDQSFIRAAIEGSARHAVVVRHIVVLARSLGMNTTAEGIESDQHLRFARISGCDYGQGYHLGTPQPAFA
jgi:EAL domain-containing protein (putative c-di-GMP-specific phosphodiesterase class I)